MGLQHKQAQGHGADAIGQQGPDRGEIAQGFTHLFAVDIHHAVVEPVAGQGLAGGCFGLGDFIFVVRKNQVGSTQVNVDGFTQFLAHHGRAFDMPTGPSLPPGRSKTGLTRFGTFPEGKIKGMAFAVFFLLIEPAAGALLLLL